MPGSTVGTATLFPFILKFYHSSHIMVFWWAQDAADFLQSLERVLEQFARAMLHISRGYALPEDDFQVLSVSHGPASTARDPWKAQASSSNVAEAVVARAPKWDTQIATPASWAPDKARTFA
jgi:hypothetical protein